MVFLVSSMGDKRSKVRGPTGKYYTWKKRICDRRGLRKGEANQASTEISMSSSGLHDDTVLVLVGFVAARWTRAAIPVPSKNSAMTPWLRNRSVERSL